MTLRGFFLPREKTHQKPRKNPPVKGLSTGETGVGILFLFFVLYSSFCVLTRVESQ